MVKVKENPYRFRVEVQLALFILCKELARSMSEQLMVGNLELKSSRVPFPVEFLVVWVDERKVIGRCFGSKNVLNTKWSNNESLIRDGERKWSVQVSLTASETFCRHGIVR